MTITTDPIKAHMISAAPDRGFRLVFVRDESRTDSVWNDMDDFIGGPMGTTWRDALNALDALNADRAQFGHPPIVLV